jgi:GMP synthase (glutamine-hydrolysing)
MGSLGSREILLVDMVDWPAGSDTTAPLRNVFGWFLQHFPEDQRANVRTVSTEQFLASENFQPTVAGVLMSGSPRDAWVDDSFTSSALRKMDSILEQNIPFLGVCYGHQLLGRALGAKVGPDPGGLELGTIEVRLTEEGERSPLFRNIPKTVLTQESHRDTVQELPAGATLLARNNHCLVQSFQHRNQFGVQFHPEMTPQILQFLWKDRIERWQPKIPFDLRERLQSLRPTPEAPHVLRNFVQWAINRPTN